MSLEEGAMVLTGETLAKAIDLLMNPDYSQRAEQLRQDEAMYRWMVKEANGEE